MTLTSFIIISGLVMALIGSLLSVLVVSMHQLWFTGICTWLCKNPNTCHDFLEWGWMKN